MRYVNNMLSKQSKLPQMVQLRLWKLGETFFFFFFKLFVCLASWQNMSVTSCKKSALSEEACVGVTSQDLNPPNWPGKVQNVSFN